MTCLSFKKEKLIDLTAVITAVLVRNVESNQIRSQLLTLNEKESETRHSYDCYAIVYLKTVIQHVVASRGFYIMFITYRHKHTSKTDRKANR
jgi:hypothetical protein